MSNFDDAMLLQKINRELPVEDWQRYTTRLHLRSLLQKNELPEHHEGLKSLATI